MPYFHFSVFLNVELVLSHKHKLSYFTLVARDERKKSKVNFEAYTAFTLKLKLF